MYEKVAFLYDEFAGFDYPAKVAQAVQLTFQHVQVNQPALIGDFGAGTGSIAIQLAQLGWNLFCVERSTEMIQKGKGKIALQPISIQNNITWLHADITHGVWPEEVILDAAICLCNTINHLTEHSDLEGFAALCFKALKKEGVLVLDSDTLETFQHYFHHKAILVLDKPPYKLYRTACFNETTGRVAHTSRLEETISGSSEPTILEEPLELQYHSPEVLKECFESAGFKVELCVPFNPFPDRYTRDFTPKLLWVFRK
jgi:SAM-dependent methyltransferase